MTMHWFGVKPWAPLCGYSPRAETPVGEPCMHCGEPIAVGDDGVMMPCGANELRPAHYECNLRSILGGLNHLLGRCTCCGGVDDPDPSWMTRRQAAQAAVNLYNGISLICPDCRRISYSREDVAHRYCGGCHKFLTSNKPPSLSNSSRTD